MSPPLERFGPAGLVIRFRVSDQFVELAALGIARNLVIEQARVEVRQPVGQLRDLGGVELFDISLDLFDLRH